VVSRPRDPRLITVLSAEVEAVLADLDGHGFEVGQTLYDPMVRAFLAAVGEYRPHLVHFMGHGQFHEQRGEGSLAFVDEHGEADWVTDRDLAEGLRRLAEPPRILVLHACEGARADFDENFAGVAPQLIRAGVQCVVAMQFAVTNQTATDFSREFYRRLAGHAEADRAVQSARLLIGDRVATDPRLLGIPVVYQHGRPVRLTAVPGEV
jgi:CHAT domain-containing protein